MSAIWIWLAMGVYFAGDAYLLLCHQPAQGDQVRDKGTQKKMVLVGSLAYVLAFWMGISHVGYVALPQWTHVLALGLIVAGIMIRWMAIRTLWEFFTVRVSIRNNHRLVDNGLYRHLRHPSYTGIFFVAFGCGLALSNVFSLIILMWGFGYIIEERVAVEELALKKAFGARYENYIGRTKRYLWGVY